jgi:hypothetical protein
MQRSVGGPWGRHVEIRDLHDGRRDRLNGGARPGEGVLGHELLDLLHVLREAVGRRLNRLDEHGRQDIIAGGRGDAFFDQRLGPWRLLCLEVTLTA